MKSSSSSSNDNSNDDSILSLNRRVEYGMGGIDLSTKWLELVQNDQVAVTTTIPASSHEGDDNNTMIPVRYGVRIHPHSSVKEGEISFMEFVEQGGGGGDTTTDEEEIHPKIAQMSETLQRAAQLLPPPSPTDDATTTTGASSGSSSLQCRYDGNYAAQLQLVRTLRPPPSPGFGQQSTDFQTSCRPPPYKQETDSLVTGPLRLQLRPRVATLDLPSLTTPWDLFHNISPADVRGHFLLLPTILDENKNWRCQALVPSDCADLVHLTASIQPVGSLLTCYNSVGAGASQNHIHCHVWPTPPIPLIHKQQQGVSSEGDHDDHDDEDHSHSDLIDAYKEEQQEKNEDEDPSSTIYNKGWDCYAPTKVDSIHDFVDIMMAKTYNDDENDDDDHPLVEVSYLEYPCFCVQLSATGTVSSTSSSNNDNRHQAFDALGKAVWEVVECLQERNAPHNVCMVNRPATATAAGTSDEDYADAVICVDVFVFGRSRERSPSIIPASKAGASEMMGVFHCHNLQQLEELVMPPANNNNRSGGKTATSSARPMVQLLQDVSYEGPIELWETIKARLEGMMMMP